MSHNSTKQVRSSGVPARTVCRTGSTTQPTVQGGFFNGVPLTKKRKNVKIKGFCIICKNSDTKNDHLIQMKFDIRTLHGALKRPKICKFYNRAEDGR
uniref:Uncharacterized protein n=1 Tax=Romanomermis culicivorax TaxID=13658 RepID=A0A915IA47_ROMCU